MQELLFERIRNFLMLKGIDWDEKKMMGGLSFMVDDKLCFGSFKDGLLCRIDPIERDALINERGGHIMTQAGREMKGYVHILSDIFDSDQELEFWIDKCLEFNPKAKVSKKRKKGKK